MELCEVEINEFCEISSSEKTLPKRDAIADEVRKYDFVVQYTNYGVDVLDADDYSGIPDGFLELRAFDELGELHVVDVDGELRGRVRTDADGVGAVVFDEEHQLWGKPSSMDEGVVVLEEDRGTLIRIPGRAIEGIDANSIATIRVRNYLDESEIDPVTGDTCFAFTDYRFVGFKVREGE